MSQRLAQRSDSKAEWVIVSVISAIVLGVSMIVGWNPIGLLFVMLVVAVYFIPTFVALERKWRKKDVLGVFLVNLLAGITVVGWFIALFSALTREGPLANTNSQSGLTVGAWNLVSDQKGRRYIVGTVNNSFGREFRMVAAEFHLYDGLGNLIGNTSASIGSIPAYGTWKFSAPVEPGTASAKFNGVVGL